MRIYPDSRSDPNVFGARRTDTGALVGMCYLKPEGPGWELGGLLVSDDVQGRGIGTLIARLVTTYALAQLDIVTNNQALIAHVHERNQDPRGILNKLGFEWVERITLTGADAADAPSFLRNEAGNVVGDVLKFTRQGILNLAHWLKHEFRGTLERSGAKVQVNFGPFPLDAMADAVYDIAQNLSK